MLIEVPQKITSSRQTNPSSTSHSTWHPKCPFLPDMNINLQLMYSLKNWKFIRRVILVYVGLNCCFVFTEQYRPRCVFKSLGYIYLQFAVLKCSWWCLTCFRATVICQHARKNSIKICTRALVVPIEYAVVILLYNKLQHVVRVCE